MILAEILPPLAIPDDPSSPVPCWFGFGLSPDKKKRKVAVFTALSDVDAFRDGMTGKGWSAYVSQASFGDVTKGRKKENALEMKAFWLDIDVGKDANAYPDRGSAFNAVLDFTTRSGLVPRFVTSSGFGLYLHYVLTRPIPASQWRSLSLWLGNVVRKFGLIADPACTTDASRILRIPGSLHPKAKKKVATLSDSGFMYTPEEWVAALHAAMPDGFVTARPIAQKAPDFFAEPPRYDAEVIAGHCKQIAQCGLAPEPVWFSAMSVLKRCHNGHEWVHRLSAMDQSRYDHDQTEAKYARAPDDAPCKCETFESLLPQNCGGCRFRQVVTSPVQIQRNLPPAAVPVAEAAPSPVSVTTEPDGSGSGDAADRPEWSLTIPDEFDYQTFGLTDGQFVVTDGGVLWFEEKYDKKSGVTTTTKHLITDSRIFYLKTDWSHLDGVSERMHWFRVVRPDGHAETMKLDAGTMASPQGLMARLMSSGVVSNDSRYDGRVFGMLFNTYMRSLMTSHAMQEIASAEKFGWVVTTDSTGEKVDGFSLGCGLLTHEGLKDQSYAHGAATVAEGLGHAGTLEGWTVAADLYRKLDQKPGMLGVCLSFASPLMRYGMGLAKSATYSLWSSKSGKGKTHLLRTAASVWGHPDRQFLHRNASDVARMRRMATLKNIPCFLDELTDVADDDLFRLAFSLVGGKEKDKLKRNGKDVVITGDWNLVTFCTANKSFKEAVSRMAGSSDAPMLRLLEYECDFEDYSEDVDRTLVINEAMRAVEQNYGLAGPEFMHRLMNHSDRLGSLEVHVENFMRKHGFAADERFICSALALAVKAGQWAKEWGLIRYDMDELEQWAVTTLLEHNRRTTKEAVKSGTSVVRAYLMDRQRNLLKVLSDSRSTPVPAPSMPDLPYIQLIPLGSIYVRYAEEEERLYIDQRDFRLWCARFGYSEGTVWRQTKEEGLAPMTDEISLTMHISKAMTPKALCYRLEKNDVRKLGVDFSAIVEVANGQA